MNFGIILSIFCVILGISFVFHFDIAGMFSFMSLGISLALMESIGNNGLLAFVNQQGVPSIKVIFAWVSLIIFIITFLYKVLRDHQNYF